MTKSYTWNLLLRHRTVIMGVMPILIILLHFRTDFASVGADYTWMHPLWYGDCGVDAFLFLSGIGLWCSYEKCPHPLTFYKKRFIRVFIPYLIIAFAFCLWRYILVDPNIYNFFAVWLMPAYILNGNAWFWYVVFIFFAYLLYPILHKIMNKRKGGEYCSFCSQLFSRS